MKVTLSNPEMLLAAQVGVMRRVKAITVDRQARYGFDGEPWGSDIESCGAEMAIGKLVGTYWSPDLVPGPGDVGNIEVRSSTKADARLILHPDDPDEALFILVTGRLPEFEVHGAIVGKQGKVENYWTDPGTGRPAFFVPREALRPLSDFNLRPAPLEAA